MTNETTYSNVIIGAVQTKSLAIIADKLVQCEVLYHDKGWVYSTIRCMTELFSSVELRALRQAKLICNPAHNAVLFAKDLGNIVKEYANEDGIKIKDCNLI